MILAFVNNTDITTALLITLAGLIVFILYRNYIRRQSREHVNLKNYATLFGLEFSPAQAEIELYFTIEKTRSIKLELLDDQWNFIEIIKEGEFEKGGHVVRFDTTKVKNGSYFYQLVTDNQKTAKKMLITNS